MAFLPGEGGPSPGGFIIGTAISVLTGKRHHIDLEAVAAALPEGVVWQLPRGPRIVGTGPLASSIAPRTVPGTGGVAVIPPPAPSPGIDPTTDISAILKKLPFRVGPQLAEWFSRYKFLLSAATYLLLSDIIDEYNKAQALDEKSKADAIRKADKEYAAARRTAIKEARAQAKDAREQKTFEQAQADRARREVERVEKELDRGMKAINKQIARARKRGEKLDAELRAMRKAIPPVPPFKSARQQTIEKVLKGIVGYQQIRASLKKPAAVNVSLGQGVPAPAFVPGLTAFDTTALGLDTSFPDLGQTTNASDEVCSCRPRYRKRKRKSGKKKICYYRKAS